MQIGLQTFYTSCKLFCWIQALFVGLYIRDKGGGDIELYKYILGVLVISKKLFMYYGFLKARNEIFAEDFLKISFFQKLFIMSHSFINITYGPPSSPSPL